MVKICVSLTTNVVEHISGRLDPWVSTKCLSSDVLMGCLLAGPEVPCVSLRSRFVRDLAYEYLLLVSSFSPQSLDKLLR